MAEPLVDLSVTSFARDGFLVVRGLAEPEACEAMRRRVLSALDPLEGPAEFEADVGYPGAPKTRADDGGHTPRRLLNAYSRDDVFRRWVTAPALVSHLRAVLGDERIQASQCHHNCVMTKFPGFSSETNWHQDVRYWSFDAPELVSVWLALGPERVENGALAVIPGSHKLTLGRGRLDRDLFLRPELAENRRLIDSAKRVELDRGDALLFHCRLFHAAGMNRADQVKLSVVFTYHRESNRPIPGTRSDQYPSISV